MSALLDVILPVFLIIGFGYLAVRLSFFSDSATDGLMAFTQHFAIPCLLFRAIATIDLGAEFRADLLFSFYAGVIMGFTAGLLGARYLFSRSWEDSVSIGFCAMFSNSILLGVPLAERAFGTEALAYNYAIIALHAPICYFVGVTLMELVRARGEPIRGLPLKVLRAMLRNALVIGIVLGFVVNFAGIGLPSVIDDALEMMIRAALPAALFGLGGVLARYRPEGDMRVILWVCGVSLVLHPSVTYLTGSALGLGRDPLRAAVITGAMAPGANGYIFASLYGAAPRVAASSVLIGTILCVGSVWVWLLILP
ncbi:hypothetical protein LX81_01537 [Palleronia aestuarii]|uniref:Malonate transporter n=1 Tax=Palleronia aestuarii TaxID=568105 RepID=A0A2W7NCB0_9RHOB|nr:AEC family transporter [Palleronia aestuarii]PZX17808.1 hypothetical protein LX81_01537 [Palleronia aestuarii]